MHTSLLLPFFWLANHFADLSRASSNALIAAIWQGTLLAAVAALALRLVPRIPAAARFAIWFAVFALIAALPFAAIAPHRVAPLADTTPARAWVNFDPRWSIAIAAIWAAASLFRAATLIAAALRVRSLSRNAKQIELSPAPAIASRRVQLCSSIEVDRPTVIGFFSPKILIPAWLLDKLTPAELEHVILHEAGHLNRADDWLNLLQKLALVLFPLNPALAWVERRLCFERELACDERVLAALAASELESAESGRAATGYASSLATLAEYRLQRRGLVLRAATQNLALALGALGTSARQSELGRRVARILRPVARMKPLHVRLATGCAVVALLFATTELERCPQMISFAASAPAPQVANLTPETSQTGMLPGYRAVAARITLPIAPQMKSAGDAAPHIAATPRATIHAHSAILSADETYATNLRDAPTQESSAARMIAVRQPEQQPGLVVTRYTVTTWQSTDGYRVVRTSAVYTAAPAATPVSSADSPASSDATSASAPRARQISQPVSHYAAVPVPGGWLVFQL